MSIELTITTLAANVFVKFPDHFPWQDHEDQPHRFLSVLQIDCFTVEAVPAPTNSVVQYNYASKADSRVAKVLFGDALVKEINALARATRHEVMAQVGTVSISDEAYQRIINLIQVDCDEHLANWIPEE